MTRPRVDASVVGYIRHRPSKFSEPSQLPEVGPVVAAFLAPPSCVKGTVPADFAGRRRPR